MSVPTTDNPGRGAGVLSAAATTTTVGAVSLPFTGAHHTISIVGLVAVAFGLIVLVAHFGLRMYSAAISRR